MKENTCLVLDIWEGNPTMDYPALKTAGIAGISLRLNDMNGGHHKDIAFDENWKAAAGFVRFPYFVYNPWVNGQKNFAWLLEYMPSDALSVAVDIEVVYSQVTPQKYAAEVAIFMAMCKEQGWKTIVYTAEFFLPKLSKWPAVDYWWAQYPDKPTYFKGTTTWEQLKIALDNPKLASAFNAQAAPGPIKLWQFGGDFAPMPGTGKGKIDINLFYGTRQELAEYFKSFPTEIIVVPPTPKYYRLLHDTERADMNYTPRKGPQTNPESTPETVRLNGGKSSVILSPAWVTFHDNINTLAAQRFNRKNGSGWFNLGEWPTIQQLTFGGNVVEVTEIEGDKAYVKTYYNDDPPPDISAAGFYDPARIHYFSVIREDGSVEGAPVGNVRTFIIARDHTEKLWIPLSNLTPVDELTVYIPGTPVDPEPTIIPSNLYTFAQSNYWPRPGGGPLVLPVSRVRGKADNMNKLLWSTLKPALEKLNPANAKDAVAKCIASDWGPSKGLDGKNIKWIGLLWPGRNVVKISEIIDGYGRVDGVALGSVSSLNAYDNPEVVSMVYDYHKTNGYGARTKPIYVPIIGGPWWIDMKTLSPVDAQLPKKVKVLADMNLRDAPLGEVVGSQPAGEVWVTSVTLGKGGIWGKVAGGWIALRFNGANMTNWQI